MSDFNPNTTHQLSKTDKAPEENWAISFKANFRGTKLPWKSNKWISWVFLLILLLAWLTYGQPNPLNGMAVFF